MGPSPNARPGPRALSGLRICDLSGQLAGAGATRTLAAFGAEVLRIEDPVRQGKWDITRGAPPYVDDRRGVDLGGAFNNHNVEKIGATLNLRTAEGREILARLVARSDVFTENFSPGVLARLGFDWERLRVIRPDLVYVSNSGFGHSGPFRDFRSWGPIVQALSGLTSLGGLPGRPPSGWGFSYMDHHGANFMACAVLAGLLHRARTGEGVWVDMACVEAGASMLGPEFLDVQMRGADGWSVETRDSNRSSSPRMAPHGVYPTAEPDRWIVLACPDDDCWRRMAAIIPDATSSGLPLEALAGRLAYEDELDAMLANWSARQERGQLITALTQAGVPASVVALPEDRIEHDEVTKAWGLWPFVEHASMGRLRVDGLPVHLEVGDWVIERGAPTLGEHNAYVYGEVLGYSEAERARLHDTGVI